MIGRRLAHYDILAELGQGGMGSVYRAHDTRLGREVAIKILREELVADGHRLSRLIHEARALASLNHPNVATVHEIHTEGDRPFLVMELVDGVDLAQRLRAGAFSAEEVKRIGAQIARGLVAAHRRGIVHRDLKPANVRITPDGVVKILDFGLAKQQLPDAGDETLRLTEITQTGAVVGTPAYMAPERLRGEPGDHRGDVFALGILLYEMLSGSNPFARTTQADTISALLVEQAQPLRAQPTALRKLVAQCLEKDPSLRIQSAAEIAQRLSEEGHDDDASIDSIAVLPFHNEAGDEDADYLIDGLCDSLIDNLSHLPRLKVMARSTVFRCRELHDRPDEVGRELQVRAVLTGRVQRRGKGIVIRSELVDSVDGARLWGGRFTEAQDDMLAVESEICRQITERLRFRLTQEEEDRVDRNRGRDPRAHELYLRGRYFWNRWKTADAMHSAIRLFEQALQIDPNYALAHGGLADAYNILGNVKALAPNEAYPRAKDEVRKGLALDDSLAELHCSLGFIHRYWDWNWGASEREFQRAIELNPGYSVSYRFYAQLLCGLGRREESIRLVRRALDLDPLSILLHTTVGDAHFYARRYDEAVEFYRKAIEMDDAFIPAHTDLGRALELMGDFEGAIACFERARQFAPSGVAEPSSGLAHVYARMGLRDDAMAIVEQLLERSKHSYISPYGIGSIFANMGENATALDWLEKAFDQHDQTLVWLKVHPRLEGLHGEPRYQALLARMDLA